MERSYFDGLEDLILWKWLLYQKHLQIQCNLHQNLNAFLHSKRGKKSKKKIQMKAQKTTDSLNTAKRKC